MKNDAYVESMIPVVEKSKLLEDLRMTRSEYKETTAPAFDDAAPIFRSWKFKDTELQTFERQLGRVKGFSSSEGLINAIGNRLTQIQDNLVAVEDLVNSTFDEQEASRGLTYKKVQLMQYIEAAGFVARYARRLLLYVYNVEVGALQKEKEVEATVTAQAAGEVAWIIENWTNFTGALASVSGKTNDLKQAVEDIPEFVVTKENVRPLAAAHGEGTMDPFNMRFLAIRFNPIYHLRMIWVEWQVSRYKIAKDELRLLELKRLQLLRIKEGKQDARLEKEIEILEVRISDLKYEVMKMEKKNG